MSSLSALHTQLTSLEHQKTLLTTKLLSLRASHPLSTTTIAPPTTSPPSTPDSTPHPDPPSHLSDADILSHVFASTSTHQTTTLSRLHRITGITTFAVRDPSPPHPTLLGIRIEVFSQRKFQTPHYILLSFPTTAKPTTTFTIHRHTLPPFLPLPRQHPRNLSAFVRCVRKQLLQHARRVEAVQELKEKALNAGRVGDVTEGWVNRVESVEWDEEVSLVVVKWCNGTTGWVRVGETGRVGRVVVKDRKGGRDSGVERRMEGLLEGVAGRMGWV